MPTAPIAASPLYIVILACEIGFWVLVAAGLTARYLLGRPRLGLVLLAGAPLVDLLLLAAATIDLRAGARAELPHALAAVYIGVSVAWGHRLIGWADSRVAHRFAGGPRPVRPPRTGPAHAARERREWLRHALAWFVGVTLLGLSALLVGGRTETEVLTNVAVVWTVVLAVDFLISFSYTLWPRRARTG